MHRHRLLVLFAVGALAAGLLAGAGSARGRLGLARTSADASDDAVHLELVGQIGGSVWAVDLVGTTAYAAIGSSFVVLDVSDQRAVYALGSTLLDRPDAPRAETQVLAVKAVGQYVYVASARDLQVVSVADPTAPNVVAVLPLPANDIAAAGSEAYLADDGGLRVLDVSDPAQPRAIGYLPLAALPDVTPRSVALGGDWAYVALGGGLAIVDIRQPTQPLEVRRIDVAADACAVDGAYLYSMGQGVLKVLDVATPSDPRLMGELELDDNPQATVATHLGIDRGSVYVAVGHQSLDHDNAVFVVDIADPSAPRKLGQAWAWEGRVWDVAAGNSAVLVAAGGAGLHALDLADPTKPVQLNAYVTGRAENVAVDGVAGYAVRTYGGLGTVDASDPTRPRLLGQWPVLAPTLDDSQFPTAIATSGGLTLLLDVGTDTINVLDTSDPRQPRLLAAPTYAAADVALQGSYGYATLRFDDQLLVLDLSRPDEPTDIGRAPTLAIPSGIAVVGDYAYVVTTDTVEVFDVHLPAAPQRVGIVPLPLPMDEFSGGDVIVSGTYAYALISGDNTGVPATVLVVSVADPSAPVIVGTLEFPDHAGDNWDMLPHLALSGSYLCLATHDRGLKIVDVAQPNEPVLATEYATYGAHYVSIRGVDAAGDLVFAAGCNDGVLIFRLVPGPAPTVAPPTESPGPTPSPTPTPAPQFEPIARLGGRSMSLAVDGRFGYMGVGAQLVTVDLSMPAQPRIIGQSETADGLIIDLAVAGDHVFAAAQDAGIVVFDVSDRTRPRIVGRMVVSGFATRMATDGRYLYAAIDQESNGTILALDISDPTQPRQVGAIPIAFSPGRLVVVGSALYVGAQSLWIFDVSDPAGPRRLSKLDFTLVGYERSGADGMHADLDVADGMAYLVIEQTGAFAVDVSDPGRPALVWELQGSFSQAAVVGDTVCLGDRNGLWAFDRRSNPTTGNVHVREFDGERRWSGLVPGDGFAFGIRGGFYAIQVLADGTVAPQPRLTDVLGDSVGDIAWEGNLAYVGTSEGVAVVDVTEETSPRLVRTIRPGANLYPLAVKGDLLFGMTDGGRRLLVTDTTGSGPPTVAGEWAATDWAGADMELVDDFLIVAGRRTGTTPDSGRLGVIDVTDPAAPTLIAHVDADDPGEHLAVAAGFAYTINYSGGSLDVFAISDPRRPALVGQLPVSDGQHRALDAERHLVFYGDGPDMVVVDASEPNDPKRIGVVRIQGAGDADYNAIDGIRAQLRYVYVSAPYAGVHVIDVSDPAHPVDVARGHVPVWAGRLEVQGQRICLFDDWTGLLVYRSPFWRQSGLYNWLPLVRR